MPDDYKIIVRFDLKEIDKQLSEIQKKAGKTKVTLKGGSENRKLNKDLKETSNIFTQIGKNAENAFKKVLGFFLISGTVATFFRTIRDGLSTISELDARLTTIASITGKTRLETDFLAQSYNDLAKELGSTTLAVAEGFEIFARQGLAVEESLNRLEVATKASNLAGIGLERTSNLLTAAVNGMNISIEEASDTMLLLGARAGTSFEELAEATSKAAGTASALGVTFLELESFIATVSEVTRESASSIGSSFKTIFARMAALKENTAEAREELNKVDEALDSVGVSLTDTAGQIRPLGQVITDLGKVFGELDRNTQAYLATTIAGTRQQSRFLALMQNIERQAELYDIALQGANTTNEQYSVFTESITANVNKFRAELEDLYLTLADSSAINNFLKISTGLVGVTDTLFENVGLLNGAFILATGGLVLFNRQLLVTLGLKLAAFMENIIVNMKLFTSATTAASLALSGLALGIPLIIGGIAKWIRTQNEAIQSLQIMSEELKQVSKEASAVDELVVRFEQLGRVTDKSNKQQEEFARIRGQLNQLLPQAKRIIDEENDSLEEQIELYKELNAQRLDEAILEAQRTVVNLEKDYEFLTQTLENLETTIPSLKQQMQDLVKLQKEQGGLTDEQITKFNALDSQLTTFEKIQKDATIQVEAYENAVKLLNDVQDDNLKTTEEVSKKQEVNNTVIKKATDSTKILEQAMRELDETGRISIETFLQLQEELPKVAEEIIFNEEAVKSYEKSFANATKNQIALEKQLVKNTIETVKARITAYQKLLDAIFVTLRAEEDEINILRLEKAYAKYNAQLTNTFKELDGLISKSIALDNVQSKSNRTTKKKIDLDAKYLLQLAAVRDAQFELDRLTKASNQLIGVERAKALIDIINKTEALQQQLHLLNEAYRAERASLKQSSERYQELSARIQSNSNKWWDLQNAIASARQEIIDINKEINELSKSIKKQEQAMLDAVFAVDEFREETKALTEQEMEKQIGIIEDAVDALKDYEKQQEQLIEQSKERIEQLREEIKELEHLADLEPLENRLKDYERQIEEGEQALKDSLKPLEEQKKILDEIIKKKDYELDIAQHLYDQEEKRLEAEIKKIEEAYNPQIEALEAQIKALEDIDKITERELERQEKLLAIEQAKQNLKDIEKERTVQLFTGEQFELVADPRAVQKANEELMDAEEDLAEFERKTQLELLEEELERLEEERDAKTEVHEKEMEQLQEELDEKKWAWAQEKFQIEEELRLIEEQVTAKNEAWEIEKEHIQERIDLTKAQMETINEAWEDEQETIDERLEKKREELEEEKEFNRQLREDLEETMKKRREEIEEFIEQYNDRFDLRERDKLKFEEVWEAERESIDARIEKYGEELEASNEAFQAKLEARANDLANLQDNVASQIAEYNRLISKHQEWLAELARQPPKPSTPSAPSGGGGGGGGGGGDDDGRPGVPGPPSDGKSPRDIEEEATGGEFDPVNSEYNEDTGKYESPNGDTFDPDTNTVEDKDGNVKHQGPRPFKDGGISDRTQLALLHPDELIANEEQGTRVSDTIKNLFALASGQITPDRYFSTLGMDSDIPAMMTSPTTQNIDNSRPIIVQNMQVVTPNVPNFQNQIRRFATTV